MRDRIHNILLEAVDPYNKEYRVLYHGTKKELVPKILKRGLILQHDQSARRYDQAIYLTDDIETAKGYGPVVLAIDVSQLDPAYMTQDDFEFDDLMQEIGNKIYNRDDDEEDNNDIEDEEDNNDIEDEEDNDDDVSEDEEEMYMYYQPYGSDWELSLAFCNQMAYLNNIPPSAISIYDGK